jgi:hypothetical protein
VNNGAATFAAPNLAGDDVPFVRKDASGNVTSWGVMNRQHIADEAGQGVLIEETETLYVPPPSDLTSVQLVRTASLEMTSSDRYFLTDALNYIDAAKQKEWEEYRKELHKMLAANAEPETLPGKNPDGHDAFAQFRKPK